MSEIEDKLQLVGLDLSARAQLRDCAPVIVAALPAVLDEFYREFVALPRVKQFFPDDAVVAHAKASQLRHWGIIASAAFDGAYVDSAVRIGQAHHRIGLPPGDYIAGYARLLAALHREVDRRLPGWRRRRTRQVLRDALSRAALLDMDLALSVYNSRAADDDTRAALRDMCEIIEADLDSAVSQVLVISNDAATSGERAADDAKAIAAEACAVAASSEQASANVASVSEATDQLSVAGREIARRAAETAEFASRAAGEIERASSTAAELKEAATRIGAVTNLISEVASQTNLLALNATIEAARAGEAGKGFAVVAHEVKALSRKTGEAAEDISRRIQDIYRASQESVDLIGRVGSAVSGIREITGAVAAAAEEQETTLLGVARSITEASQGVAAVSRNVNAISGRSAGIETSSRLVSELVNGTNGRISELRANLLVSLRSSSAGDRRSAETRRPVSVKGRLRCGGQSIEGTVLDLSEGGLRFRANGDAAAAREGNSISAETAEFGTIEGTIIAVGVGSIHVQFGDLTQDERRRIETFLRGVDEADRRFVAATRDAAAAIGKAFEAAIARGEISMQQLFDFDYRPIPGTAPQQYLTPSLPVCDRILPDIQEPLLELDPRVVFCAAVDSNAFLPTHNRKFALEQKPNDPVWNAANCRHRRFFKDSAGLRAARTTRDYLLQTYDREMGGGVMVTLKEVDAPIRVQGRHWGGLRLAFKA